ncbi:insulinase family protein [Methylobacterium sp. E-041]|jgi:predicted Zn-dependent peptidase|uniref:M16 family metallopeptidase n=1 Tax=unclassified Methylobacterium TaxID=2615210 RepID=UPI0011CC50B6|nr:MULTISPECIES: pitrilysin family protein [unclassified Methylobacterium]MCJ2040016.1 insulinase family protein [Methylobacterium sp. J-059]MCJ2104398.1 insulinase family protein [Methylobacterium sp. E-041]TXN72605.1 insulinase family protein [Methylobacterium sp. WL6]
MNQHFATHAASPGLRITTLDNGVTVATEAMPGVATATLGVWVGAGSRHERPDENGLSHLIEHMAFKGTRTRSARAIAEDIENLGGEINAATSAEGTSYTARVLGEDVGTALDVLGDILTDSVFDAGELAREKGVILQEHAGIEDTPDDVVYDAFTEAAFPGQPIGRPIIGRPETIRSFDEAGIRAYLAREYTPDRFVVAAAGAVEHEAFVASAERHFGAMPRSSAPEAIPGTYAGGERRMPKKLEQANVVIGLPGLSFRDDAYYALHMFSQVLGGGLTSRLWQEVRETRGLAYEIQAFHWPFSDCGLFGIGAATSGADLPELVEVTLSATARAARDLDTVEIARAKAQLKVSLLSALETPGGRIERNARQILAWGRVIPAEEVIAKVDAVTVDHVRAAGLAVLAGAPTLAAIGPIKKLPSLDRITAVLRAA